MDGRRPVRRAWPFTEESLRLPVAVVVVLNTLSPFTSSSSTVAPSIAAPALSVTFRSYAYFLLNVPLLFPVHVKFHVSDSMFLVRSLVFSAANPYPLSMFSVLVAVSVIAP